MQLRSLVEEVTVLRSELRELRKVSLSAPTVHGPVLLTSSPVGASRAADSRSAVKPCGC